MGEKIASRASTQIDSYEKTKLIKLINDLKIDRENFLFEGRRTLSSLKLFIDYEATIEGFETGAPSYWKNLINARADYEDFDKDLTLLRQDLRTIRKNASIDNNDNFDNKTLIIEELKKLIFDEIEKNHKETSADKCYKEISNFRSRLTNFYNINELTASYSKLNAATCQQAARRDLDQGMNGLDEKYDYVIIDEAARSNPLDLFIPMSMGEKVIMVGDHKQLPHMLEKEVVDAVVAESNNEKAKEILEESLFAKLFRQIKDYDEQNKLQRTCSLNEQYRMHPDICDVVNTFYQEEKLITKCSREDKLHNLGLYDNKAVAWLDMKKSVFGFETEGQSKSRNCEVDQIEEELKKILVKNDEFKVGIITFYSKQKSHIKRMIEEKFSAYIDRISVGTVDAFQGKEFDVVLLSTVRSNIYEEIKDKLGFLSSSNRLCVAMSRAKRLLIVIGDSTTVAQDNEIPSLNILLKQCLDGKKGYYKSCEKNNCGGV